MKKIFLKLGILALCLSSCDDTDDTSNLSRANTIISFTHNWDGTPVDNTDFNTIQYTNENGEMLSIERLRYVISDIT